MLGGMMGMNGINMAPAISPPGMSGDNSMSMAPPGMGDMPPPGYY